MFQKLVSHNDDLKRLVEKGYAAAFDTGHLIIRDIPYLDVDLNLQQGTIVTVLSFIDNERVEQVDHQIFFAGSHPYNIDGSPVERCMQGRSSSAFTFQQTNRGGPIQSFHGFLREDRKLRRHHLWASHGEVWHYPPHLPRCYQRHIGFRL
jgi:hypothetical protein